MNDLNIVIKPHLDMSHLRLVNHAQFYDEKDLLVTAGIDGVFVFNFDYRGKYTPALAIQVDPKGIYIKIQLLNKQPVQDMLDWCKGLKVDTKANMMITWNWQMVSMNELTQQAPLIRQFKDLCGDEEKILDVIVFSEYRYFVTGTTTGNIYVFKYQKNNEDVAKKQD